MARSKKILLVEDDKDQVFLLTQFLELHGYEVDASMNTNEGLVKYKSLTYFCAIMDVMMPDGGAEYILKSIRNTSSTTTEDINLKDTYNTATSTKEDSLERISTPIIILTAAREDRKNDFLLMGAYAFCTKQNITQTLIPILVELEEKNPQ
jgi:CheY-like chemotaxis protein